MDLSNKLSCETRSVSCHLSPHRFFQSEVLRLYFPTLEPWVKWCVSLPSCSSQFILTQMWDHLLCQPLPCPPWSSSCHLAVSPLLPRLHVAALPAGLDECFFFNSLVVRLPYKSIFCQLWLFFVFKFVVVLLRFFEEENCIFLCLYLGQKSYLSPLLILSLFRCYGVGWWSSFIFCMYQSNSPNTIY